MRCPHNSCFGMTKSSTLEKSNNTWVFELKSWGVRRTRSPVSPGPIGETGESDADESEFARDGVVGVDCWAEGKVESAVATVPSGTWQTIFGPAVGSNTERKIETSRGR